MRAVKGRGPKLRQRVDVALEAAFQVSGFVAVDIAAFCQLVDHAHHFRKESEGFGLIFQFAQVFDGRTSCFFVVAVLQTALFRLADALEG